MGALIEKALPNANPAVRLATVISQFFYLAKS